MEAHHLDFFFGELSLRISYVKLRMCVKRSYRFFVERYYRYFLEFQTWASFIISNSSLDSNMKICILFLALLCMLLSSNLGKYVKFCKIFQGLTLKFPSTVGVNGGPMRAKICEPKVIYMKRCNVCVCSDDGFDEECTTLLCLNNNEVLESAIPHIFPIL